MNTITARSSSVPSNRALLLRRALPLLFSLLLIIGGGVGLKAEAKSSPEGRKASSKHRSRKSAKRRQLKSVASNKARRASARTEREEHEMMAEGEGDEDVEGRLNWFMFRRTYPFDSIPVDARRKAWESRPGKEKGRGALESAQALWQPIGPKATVPRLSNFGINSGRINTIAISPADSNVVLIGASTGGIWRSTDGGANFSPVSDNQVDLAIGSIAFSKSNPSIVYAGTGDGQTGSYVGTGLLKSTDGGQTWTRVDVSGLPAYPFSTNRVEVDPTNPNRVYLALYTYRNTTSNGLFIGGFYVSTDGGVSWTRTLYGNSRDVVVSANPSTPQTLYLAMDRLVVGGQITSGGAIHKSTDGGMTWTKVYDAPAGAALSNIKVAVTPADPQRVYVYSGSDSSSNLAVSTSGGDIGTWTEKSTSSLDKAQFWYNTYLFADPANANIVYVGARDVYKSTDGGGIWSNLTKANNGGSYSRALAHPDQHSFAFSPGNSSAIYIGNDGGLYKSTNGGSTFQSLNSTLSLTQFTSIARHPTNPLISYGGTQDNGTQRRTTADPNQWQDFAGGDGGFTVVDPVNPSRVYTTVYYGIVESWANNGDVPAGGTSEGTFGESSSSARIAFYPPLVGNGVNSTLYFGTWRLFVNTNPGANITTWTAPGGMTDLTKGGSDVLYAIGVGRSNPNYIYTGSGQGRAMVSTDAGLNWTDITSGLPNRSISDIKVDDSNPTTAYLAVSGFASGHIFKTVNTGANWTDISGNLPNIPVNAILIDPSNANIIYLGTDIGVFRSTTGGTNWVSFNDGLPPVIISGFAANANGQIQVATYGRGAYEMSGVSSDDFSITTDSSTQNVSPGGAANYTIRTATTSGSPHTVNLSVGGLPQGASASFNPASVTSGGTSVMTVNAGANTPGGNYTLSVNGAGTFSHSVNAILSVCGYTLSSTKQSFPSIGGGATVNVNSTGVCGWAVSNNAPWIAIFSSGQDGPGNGVFTFSVAANTNTSSRTGTITVGGQTVTVTQAAGPSPPPNQIDDARNFISQHYLDFLSRTADQGGLDYWSAQITQCGIDSACIHRRRIDVSAAFFIELEFQETGSFVYRLYKASLGKQPKFAEFMPDRQTLHAGPTLEADKQLLADNFVQRSAFQSLYPSGMTNVDFVNKLYDTAGLVPYPTERANSIAAMAAGRTRAQVLRDVIEIQAFKDREYNPSFVMMQYFGYLRRDYDQGGYDFWLNVLNNREPGNFRGMVCSFITSAEYQLRFGAGVTRSNQDCQ